MHALPGKVLVAGVFGWLWLCSKINSSQLLNSINAYSDRVINSYIYGLGKHFKLCFKGCTGESYEPPSDTTTLFKLQILKHNAGTITVAIVTSPVAIYFSVVMR